VVLVPFIPLDREYSRPVAGTFVEFIEQIVARSSTSAAYRIRAEAVGKEVHEVKPIPLGGDPTPENQVLLPVTVHAEACRFWNKVFNEVRRQSVAAAT
jgi:hypothetical protein